MDSYCPGLILLLVCACAAFRFQDSIGEAAAQCSNFIIEGNTFTCQCGQVGLFTIPGETTWPGYSNTSVLEIQNVTREYNGTQFTCLLTADNRTVTDVLTLQVYYGPFEEFMTITAPPMPFVTNGSKMTLTCEATEVNPAPMYRWGGLGCDEGTPDNVCTFTPNAPFQDQRSVACIAISSYQNFRDATKTIYLNFYFPYFLPGSSQILKTGDRLECSVHGGRPNPVNVTISCQNLTPSDEYVEHRATAVGFVGGWIVNTSSAIGPNTTCVCSAFWEPEPSLYTHRASIIVETEYKSLVTSLTLNGRLGELTVNETDTESAELLCEANGRPKPDITLIRQKDDKVLVQGQNVTQIAVRITSIACEDMGRYSCVADNGYPEPDEQSVRLIVNCSPRHLSSDFTNSNMASPPTLAGSGLELYLVASPAPFLFSYHFLTNQSANQSGAMDKEMFSMTCAQDGRLEYVVGCSLSLVTGAVRKDELGVYRVTLDNGYGSFDYYFKLDTVTATTPPAATPAPPTTSSTQADGIPVVAIAGGVGGGVAFIVIVIIVACIVRNRSPTYDKPKPRRDQEPSPYTDLQPTTHMSNVQQISMDAHGVRTPTMVNRLGSSSSGYTNALTPPPYNEQHEEEEGDGYTILRDGESVREKDGYLHPISGNDDTDPYDVLDPPATDGKPYNNIPDYLQLF